MKRNDIVAYAQTFASFLMQSDISNKIKGIVLFGSAARGEFTRKSNIDIFVDASIDRKELKKELSLFEDSELNRMWKFKGINNISIKSGNLNKHPLKRSILADGIVLFGKYESIPKNMKHYFLFCLSFKKMTRNQKISVWRKLYGYSQKINKKTYKTRGIVAEVDGRRLSKGVILVPALNKNIFIQFLKKKKIDYQLFEIWGDIL